MSDAKSFRELVGVPPSTASPSDSTLLIIDAQNEYADGQLKTENVDSTRAAISSLLDTYRAADPTSGNVVHIVHQVPSGAPVFTPDTPLAKEFDELTPKGSEAVVVKQHPGSFSGTQLDEILKKRGDAGKKVVLTGYMAHVCVSTTARQAAERGYDVLLAKEAIGDRNIPGATAKEVVEMSLRELGDAFATVIGVKDIK
ncbi:putative isochorismatase family hydrolase [Rhizodiscina lignyota]|uniref:Isochorismatase family hydrolase n=1 Tax=Rhizodiscina lignyota TaxID=1504668 RepID=A0A9P4M208_9PEZI|nr:putative isochorismatase family hydrolase [Rhizodiscina lignyota]